MLKNFNVATRLFLLLALLLVVTLVVGVLAIAELRTTNDALTSIYQNEVVPLEKVKSISDAITVGMFETVGKTEAAVISTTEATAQVAAAQRTLENGWKESLAKNQNEREVAIGMRIESQMATANAATKELLGVLASGDRLALSNWRRTRMYPAYDPLVASLNELAQLQTQLASEENEAALSRYVTTRNLVGLVTLIGALIAGMIGFLIIRDLITALRQLMGSAQRVANGDLTDTDLDTSRRDEIGGLSGSVTAMVRSLRDLISDVQRSGIQINTSATEISATSRQQHTTATEVASTTLEIGATAREISATSQELARTMEDLSGSAERMAQLAGSGQENLSHMESSMHQITDATSGINDRFAVLSERASNINSVVTTIARVADRTNLLSLNAAIEAEKAGEYGRGFAVVAAEIRRLADQTAEATTNIEQMVRDIQSAVSAGVMSTDKFSEAVRRAVTEVSDVGRQLTEIIHQVQSITPRFESVVEGMQSQAEGAQQISDALGQLGEASQQTVESLAQSTQAVEQLNEAARRLQTGVTRFKLDA